ncbi:metal ABC transporter ATP-binding protein [candidate division KSB1 bacterium]|nr:metal ABC transporter ATP-binding protein [candidate division KSB1 bacterium]
MNEFAVQVNDLCVQFGEHLALEKVTLSIPKHAFVAIVGPNGAGKSTFLKVLLGLILPTRGQVKIFERPLPQVPANWIGYVPQVKTMDRTFPALAIELVITGLNRNWPWLIQPRDREKAMVAMAQVGTEHLAQRPIAKLSGGELQRVCLARSLVRQPRLVMLDEPTTGVDAVGEADIYKLLEAYQKTSDATILMITHDWHAATHHADWVLLLDRKQISFGPPAEALNEDNLRVAFGHIGHTHKLKFLVNSYA